MPHLTRWVLRRRRNNDSNLPTVEAAHLLDALQSMGWCQPAGMGVAPLSASEILAWSTLTENPVLPWEYEALRAASAAYCSQSTRDDAIEPASNENLDADD